MLSSASNITNNILTVLGKTKHSSLSSGAVSNRCFLLCALQRGSVPSDALGSGTIVVRFIDDTELQLTNKIKLHVSVFPSRTS